MKKLSPELISRTVQILNKARTDPQVKLRFGARQRARMFAAPQQQAETMYRHQWALECRNAVIQLIQERGNEFDKKFKFDSISMLDYLDVLQSALTHVKMINDLHITAAAQPQSE